MDKLQPIIANRFWILISLIVPMALYGYFSANGAIKAATAARETALQGVLGQIPSGDGANEVYTTQMKKINTHLTKEVDDVIIELWNRQTERMKWHPLMVGRVPHNFMDVEKATTFTPEAGHTFRNSVYNFALEDLMRSVEPVFPMPEQLTLPKETKQKVILIPDVPRIKLGLQYVEPKDIWDGQIDIWLTQLIFDAIRNINEDAPSISEAVVRRIEKYYLFGGDGTPVVGGAGMGMMGGMPGMGGYEDSAGAADGGMAMMAAMGGMGAAGGAAAIKSSVEFKPMEEFGSDADPNAAGSMGGGDGYEGGGADAGLASMMMSMGGGMNMGPKIRYIADSEDKPFLERGFYLSVIIKQDQIPEFLAELVAAPWPIRIHRFSIGDNKFRKKETPGMYGGGSYASMGGGYGPMGPGYEGGGYGGPEMMPDMGMAMGGRGGGGYGDFGYGGMGGGTTTTQSRFATGLPTWATEALNHPDLVQMDLCGVITMYKQPESLKIPTAGEGEAPADPATPPATDATAPATEETFPAAEDAVDPATMSAEPAAAETPATETPVPAESPAVETPPAEAPVTEPAPAATETPAPEEAADPAVPQTEGTSPPAETSNP